MVRKNKHQKHREPQKDHEELGGKPLTVSNSNFRNGHRLKSIEITPALERMDIQYEGENDIYN